MIEDSKVPCQSSLDSSALTALLERDEVSVVEWEQSVFDKAVESTEGGLVLYGAGGVGRLALKALRKNGVTPRTFADADSRLWGRKVDGLPVISPDLAAERFGTTAAFVVSVWNRSHRLEDTRRRLSSLGCKCVVSCAALFYKYPQEILPYYALDLPHRLVRHKSEIEQGFNLMADAESKREFLAELRWRMTLDYDDVVPRPAEEQYFPPELLSLGPHPVFIDCGAYTGDSLSQFLRFCQNRFNRAIAFEPDPKNFERLQAMVSGLDDSERRKIECINAAVGRGETKLRFDADGLESSRVSQNGSIEIDCTKLDLSVSHLRPSMIKMDIEGSEVEALAGAVETIKAVTPVLAICVYHQPDHFWEVPLLISSLSSKYVLLLRRYGEVPWDLVCYAIPLRVMEAPHDRR